MARIKQEIKRKPRCVMFDQDNDLNLNDIVRFQYLGNEKSRADVINIAVREYIKKYYKSVLGK